MAAERTRKRRDNLEDQLGTPVYTDDPLPPYIFTVTNLVYLSFAVEPARLTALLPPGLTLASGAAGMLAMYESDEMGWGMTGQCGGFAGVVVNEHPSPDSSESVFVFSGIGAGPPAERMSRHYYPTRKGRYELGHAGDETWCVLRDDQGRIAAEARIRRYGAVEPAASGLDRYLGWDAGTGLTSWIISVVSTTQRAELLSLHFTEFADPAWQALQPVALTYGLWIPRMLTNMSAPQPILAADPLSAVRASREALLALMDRQGRACGIVNRDAQVLYRNAAARSVLALGPLHLGTDQPRFRAALARAAQGGAGATQEPFLLSRDGGALILQLAPIDQVLAGPDTALVLIDNPRGIRAVPRAEILQLLGLTPAEARIAAAVGAGLPPREAATRLGLAESTVRSSLKVIFDKLGVGRQAELVQIVARLEAR